MRPRVCASCGRIVRGPCPVCSAARTRAKRARRPYTRTEQARRGRAVAAHRELYGDWCPGYGRPAHEAADLTADHATPVAAGGREDGPLEVLCRSCNSRKGARP